MIMDGYTGPLEDMPPNDWIVKLAGSGQKVLDFGCGIGRHSKALSKHFIEVVGYDLPNMIDIVPDSNKLNNIEYTSN
jgi:2-polyprenyl-3-methyl-5-hydroxy-6-metoxy-1,4-benzoquinol methylase